MNNTAELTAAASVQPVRHTFTKADKRLALIALVPAFLFVEFALFNIPGFITSAVYIIMLTISIVFLKHKKCRFTAHNITLAIILYVFTLVFSITDSLLIKVLNSFFMIGAFAYFIYSAAEERKEFERYLPFALLKALIEFPLSHFGTQVIAAKECTSNKNTARSFKHIILGLIIAFPLTLVVGALLASADSGMERMFNTMFSSAVFGDMVKHLWGLCMAMPVSLYFFGMLYSNSTRSSIHVLNGNKCLTFMEHLRIVPNAVQYTAVTPICILYVMFFISQANYFLSAFSASLPDGYSYAEYARRGFFELCAITVIDLAVIIMLSLLSQKCGSEKTKALKFYTTLLSLFTIVLIVVAMSKMIMYISVYGLTRLRLYTSWFMVLCGLIFILIIVKQFRFSMKFSGWCAGVFILMFGILCFGRPDWVIAKYNIEMYNAGYLEELDTAELTNMSDDAILTALDYGVIDESTAYRCSGCNTSDWLRVLNIPSCILKNRLGAESVRKAGSSGFMIPLS